MKEVFVYIDDSGSPGKIPANMFIAPDTKIWVAVILSLEEKKIIDSIIDISIRKLQQICQFSEFHFTDIYSGIKDFKGVDAKQRLEIFELFVELYNAIQPYIIVIATGKGTLENSGFSESYISKKDNGFSFSNQSDYALYTLLIQINEYFFERYKDDDICIQIIVDEGRQKVNTNQELSGIFDMLNEIKYKSSKDIYGLQFVDFIAFVVNRIQNNITKSRSNFDNKFMSIVGKLRLNSNLDMVAVSDLNNLDRDYIESILETKESVSIESIQYIEEITNCLDRIKEFISKTPLNYDKKIILQDIQKIKRNTRSEELKALLDVFELHLFNQ